MHQPVYFFCGCLHCYHADVSGTRQLHENFSMALSGTTADSTNRHPETSGGSQFNPVVVPDDEYIRGQSIPVADPVVFGVLLGPNLSGVQAPF